MNFTSIQTLRQQGSAPLDELDVNSFVIRKEFWQETGYHGFDNLRRSSNAYCSGSISQQASPFAERCEVPEHLSTPYEKVFASRSQTQAPSLSVKENYPQFPLECLDMT